MKKESVKEKWDIMIYGGTLLSMSDRVGVVENPYIGIKNGIISRIDGSEIAGDADEIIDAAGCLIMPGLVNTHTHLPMVCFRGLADDMPLMEWLNNYIFPAEARHVNREMVYAGSMLAMAEMILSGTTTFCDGYFYESSVAQAALDSRMRAVVSQGFIDYPTPDNPDPKKQQEIAERFASRWKGQSARITPAFFCHAPYTCSPGTLTMVKEIARKEAIPYLIHLLETEEEIRIIKDRYGLKPLQHLKALDVLDGDTIAVHCNWLDDDDIRIISDFNVKVSHNPESSMKLAAGVAPVPSMLKQGINVGLGTDGCASNNDLDMFREMDTAAKIHKIIRKDPSVMNARTVVEMATVGGARVLGLEDSIGSIDIGKNADIIIIDMDKPHLTPLYNLYSQLVYSACGSDVKTTIIDGRIVMNNRKLLSMDVPLIMHEVRKIADTIRKDH